MHKPNVRKSIAPFVLCALFLAPLAVSAEQQSPELNITPVVIDEKAKPRDIIKQTITIVNTTERKLNLYPSVNDIHPEEGEETFVSAQNADERSVSLANWVELSRGAIELGPGEEKQVPFVVRVHMDATPGSYHAEISFAEGGERTGAKTVGVTSVNVEVQEDIKEEMQLNKFSTDNVYLAGDDVLFNFQLENIGNEELQPKGEIRIYNRKGEEVASLEVNADGKIVSPNQSAQMASVWSAVDGLGRFKAFLTVDYGKSQTASVQDTIYFWIVPWKQLLMLFTGSLMLLVFFALYFHRWFEQRYHSRLALAGHPVASLPTEPLLPSPAIFGKALGLAGTAFGAGAMLLRKAAGTVKKIRRSRKVERSAPSVAVAEPAQQVVQPPPPPPLPPQPEVQAPQPRSSGLHEVIGHPSEWRSARPVAEQAHGHTIDLKQLRKDAGTPPESHVINLKKNK